MLNTPRLSRKQISSFLNDGFVVIPKAFSGADVTNIQDWTSELAETREEIGKHWVYHEPSLLRGGELLINRIENMTPFHHGFQKLANSLRISVQQIFGEEAVLFKDKINFKMSGGDGFKPHQDAQAGWEKYANYFINVMVCIDAATIENGCLQLARRSRFELVGNEWEPLMESATLQMDFIPYPTKPGDIIYFDSYAPHASGPNMTSRSRRLYFATFNKLSEGDQLANYYADKRKSFPPDIERESGKEYVYRV